MKIAIFDAKSYDETYFVKENHGRHQLSFFKEGLSLATVEKASGFDAVSEFVNAKADEALLAALAKHGVKVWLQRSIGYNNVDLKAAAKHNVSVFRVPDYAVETVGEHALALMMALNRQLVKAHNRTANYNFELSGLEGVTVMGSTVGVIGSGKIGQTFIKIVAAMGAKVLVFDEWAAKNAPQLAKELNFTYASLDELLKASAFISIHAPLLPTTKHLINDQTIAKMKPGVILINTGRGAIIDTSALLRGLKSGHIKGAGLDVLEREEGRFFFDRSHDKAKLVKEDPEWAELLAMDNVLITAHQAFLTEIALTKIAAISLTNADHAAKKDFSTALVLLEDGKVKNG